MIIKNSFSSVGSTRIILTDAFSIVGRVRLITADALKYPTYEHVREGLRKGLLVKSQYYNNIIPTVGKVGIALWLSNASATGSFCLYGAVGTGTTTPAITDTTLVTEYVRALISYSANINNTIFIHTFFSTSQANTAIKEYGLFGGSATSTPDSGTLMERVLLDYTKTSSETLTIETEFTIS